SPRNAQIKIHVRSGAGIAEVAVEEEGPGIPPDVLPRIFDRYIKSSQAKVRRGAGLGLAIASTVVHLHGGSISAANQPTHGAIFTVRLPLLNPTPKTA
ncbi:MAG: sensor histidine kinase, partial [Tepidisphaeraceae bacterium]